MEILDTDRFVDGFRMNLELFTLLGFTSKVFKEGLIYRIKSYNESPAEPHYSDWEQVERVLRGDLDFMPAESRYVGFIGSEKSSIYLRSETHEVAHDIFLAGGINKNVREQFYTLFEQLLEKYVNRTQPYDLIDPHDFIYGIDVEPIEDIVSKRNHASEVFARGAEFMTGMLNRHLEAMPKELYEYFSDIDIPFREKSPWFV